LAFAVCAGGALIRGAGGRIVFGGSSENGTNSVEGDREPAPVPKYRNMNELLRSASFGVVDRQGGASSPLNSWGNVRKSPSRDQIGKPNEAGERQRSRAYEAARDRASPSVAGTPRSDARQPR